MPLLEACGATWQHAGIPAMSASIVRTVFKHIAILLEVEIPRFLAHSNPIWRGISICPINPLLRGI